MERHKARLVAKGYTQTARIDDLDTFSPVIELITIRLLLSIALAKGWYLHQLDVNTAYLHGALNKEVYMAIPPGLHLSHPNLICKLQKSFTG